MATIGFIGSGNMAEALIKGITAANVYRPADILIADVRAGRVDYLTAEYKVTGAKSNTALANKADVIVLSVKPQNMPDVLDEIKDAVRTDALIISIAAGITTAKIADILGDVQVIRVMPNTPALVGCGASALFSQNASIESMAGAVRLFGAVGKAIVVDREDLMDTVTAVSGSGPAYFFLLMEEMIKTAQQLGLSAEDAKELVLQTAKGSALLAAQADTDGQSPAELRKKVTSPGGTTEAALKVFAENKFSELVTRALTAAAKRSRELSG